MTQSRSSILLAALAILVIVVVESSTQNIDKVDNVMDIDKDGNQTKYDMDIQMNFIDSELKEDANEIQEIPPEEPIVIDLGHDFNNSTEKGNATKLGENVETNVNSDVSIDVMSTTEVQQVQVPINGLNENIDKLGKTVEPTPLEATTVTIPDETISAINSMNESISSSIDNELPTIDSAKVETQTQSIEIHQETSTHHDLSIYFENEPSRARQLRGFNKETDNEVIAQVEPESDLISNISSEMSHSSDISSGQDEKKAAEDSPLSEDLSIENATAEPEAESLPNIAIEDSAKSVSEDLVEEIEAVTESVGDITNDVTVVSNEETHTIMKKPGVDDESPKNTTFGLLEKQTNDIGATRSDSELDPVVNMILNRPKEEQELSVTTISTTGNQSSDNDKQFDDVVAPLAATEKSISEEAQIPKIDKTSESKTPLEPKILDKSKEIEEDINSVDLNIETPSEDQENKLGINGQTILTEVVRSFKSHPENASNPQKNEPNSELNVINDDKTLEANLLTADIETSTQAPSHKSEEPSIFENNQEAQSNKGGNGIFKEIKEDPLNSTEEPLADIIIQENAVETSTEMPNKVLLEEHQNGTIVDNVTPDTPTDENLPAMLNDKTSNVLKEEPFSGMNSIPDSEANLSENDIETSTQSPSVNSYETELVGEVQEDQTSKTDNGIFKKADEARLNPNDESLPNPKHYDIESSTEKPNIYKINDSTNQLGTTDYARHVDSLQTMRDESSSVVSDEVIAPASVGRSFNEVISEGLGKPLPTRSVGDEPSSSSYSSEDKTTTVLVLCAATGGIFIAFSFAIYLISFQRQHGTLDIEMQEQRCGKDNLDDDDDSETRVSLLNQIPTVDSDEHSSD